MKSKMAMMMIIIMGLALGGFGSAFGGKSYMDPFNTANGTTYNCGVCHTTATASSSARNPFGADWANSTIGNHSYVLTSALANRDSDGDGYINSAEILAKTNPGDATSHPTGTADTTLPVVSAFTVPATSTSLVVPITAFTATDNVGVTGYLVNESATKPAAGNWSATAPASYTFASAGAKTLYAWARDAAGNVSNSLSGTVTIADGGSGVDVESPEVMEFTLPLTSTSLTVPILAFRAIDNVAPTAYLITTTPTAPAVNATGWKAAPPTSYTFTSGGAKTLYGWARDAAGNISENLWDNVDITASSGLPDISVKTSLDFEGVQVNESKAKDLKVTNQGKATLVVTKVEVIGTDAAAFKPSAASFNVNPSVEYKLRINFKPTAQRSYRATLKIYSNDPDSPVKEVALTGAGTR